MKKINQIKEFAKTIRISAINMVYNVKSSHLGGALSMADILSVLYLNILNITPANFNKPDRDRFILSKGHTCSTLYATLAERGFFSRKLLEEYCEDGSDLPGHITKSALPGIEFSTGSLGHGLPVACGMALAAKRDKLKSKVFVLLGDGECDEGSIWEAFLFAQQYRLDNLVVIIDKNKIQSLGDTKNVLNLDPLDEKIKAFNWNVKVVDGHDIKGLLSVFKNIPFTKNKPSCVIANTVKGKGVSFMENKLLWHYKSPSTEELELAIKEIEAKK